MFYLTVAPAMAAASKAAFTRAIREHEPAFVHAHDLYPTGAAAMSLTRGTGLPLIVTVHGSDLYANLARDAWRDQLRSVVDAASAIVCVGERLARDTVFEAGADPRRTLVIPSPYDTSAFGHIERAQRAPDRPLRLLSVGRLVDVKGYDLLVEAVAALVTGGKDVTLRIVGDGPQRAVLQSLISARRLGDRITLAGQTDKGALLNELGNADLFVLASRREGLGVALIEALATGLPAVATKSGGPEGILRVGQGELVRPDDATALAEGISRALENMGRYDRRAIAESARQRFGAESVARSLTRLYEEVLAYGRPKTGVIAEEQRA